MPYYYLIPEAPDEPEVPVRGWSRLQKPESYNLLLPSIHASRCHNVLRSDEDPARAVTGLISSCKDSCYWPSSRFSETEVESGDFAVFPEEPTIDKEELTTLRQQEVSDSRPPVPAPPRGPMYAKYKPTPWTYNTVDSKTLDAARSLFFERRKQQMVCESSWGVPSGALRLPSEYDLFIAWASLSKTEKMKYICEVSGATNSSPIQSQIPENTLETERAVNALYSSCPDSHSWPSFEFLRAQKLHNSHFPLPRRAPAASPQPSYPRLRPPLPQFNQLPFRVD